MNIGFKKINKLDQEMTVSSCCPYRGEVMNGGFGLVLDGSVAASRKAKAMLNWDVSNGVARRYTLV